jgi:hypothetical protein
LAHPVADFFASFCGQSSESQASLLRLIRPRHCAVGFDSLVVVREPETDRPMPLNRIKGVKAKSSIRDIQYDAAVIRLDIDIGVPLDCRPWSLAAFQAFHWQHH